jgi:hypothetical protein
MLILKLYLIKVEQKIVFLYLYRIALLNHEVHIYIYVRNTILNGKLRTKLIIIPLRQNTK